MLPFRLFIESFYFLLQKHVTFILKADFSSPFVKFDWNKAERAFKKNRISVQKSTKTSNYNSR